MTGKQALTAQQNLLQPESGGESNDSDIESDTEQIDNSDYEVEQSDADDDGDDDDDGYISSRNDDAEEGIDIML